MSDLVNRIDQRLKVIGKSRQAASQEAGLGKDYIRDLERKNTNPTIGAMEKLAPVLGWTVEQLRAGVPPSPLAQGEFRPPPVLFDPGRPLPVHAAAEGGQGTIILSTDPVEYIPRPAILANVEDAYGIVIEGESMIQAYRPGDTAWVNPVPGPRRDEPYIFYNVAEDGTQKATIKWLLNWTDDEWSVEQFNPPKKFKLKRNEWQTCHRVVGKTNRP